MADAMEMMVLSIIAPYLKCKWNLTSFEEAFITTVSWFSSVVLHFYVIVRVFQRDVVVFACCIKFSTLIIWTE